MVISVEGFSGNDRYKGKRVPAGLLVADTIEYYGDEDLASASRIVLSQLKYSMQHPERPWSWSEMEPMLAQFAARFRDVARKCGVVTARSKLRFRFVTKRPISTNVVRAIGYLTGRTVGTPKDRALNAVTALNTATKLTGRPLSEFLNLVELGTREISH